MIYGVLENAAELLEQILSKFVIFFQKFLGGQSRSHNSKLI